MQGNNIPKKIISFNDARMSPKNETLVYDIVKKAFIACIVIILAGSIIFREFLPAELPGITWVCVLVVIVYLVKKGGHERRECPSELQFFDDYMIFAVPKHHVKRNTDLKEIQKIYYKDVTGCTYRVNTRKVVITGQLEEWHYKYDKVGNLQENTCYHKKYDGLIKFYTLFDTEHDFKKIIEENTPLQVTEESA